MSTALSTSTSTNQSLDTSVAAPVRFDHDTKVIAVLFAAAIVLSALLSAVAVFIYNTASPEQLDQIAVMMNGYTPSL